jgi:hypothetical protein
MGFIKARGNNFYYEEQGKGPPILLIPPQTVPQAGHAAGEFGPIELVDGDQTLRVL